MAKWYRIIFIVVIGIVLFFIIKTFLPYLKLAKNNFENNKEGSKGTSSENVRMQSVGEAYIPDSVKEYNKSVKHKDEEGDINHSGVAGEIEAYETPIYGGYEVAKHFKESSHYYKGEIKLEEAFYNYIPEVRNSTAGMSNSALASYFEANAAIIESKLGITNPDSFIRLIGSFDKVGSRKITSINIPQNAITENSSNMSINFLIKFTLDDGSSIAPVSVNISHLKSSANQSAPYVQITGLFKSERV